MIMVLTYPPGFRFVGKMVFWLLICCVAAVATAGNENALQAPQTTGLVWNRTGLPAVFPLQVKTSPGQDYFLKLIDDETDEDALAAYIIGGEFFKVLVPPGTYFLHFSTGDVWQGEDRLFGPDENTRTIELNHALTFEIRDLATKSGHLVDITNPASVQIAQAVVREQFICQATRTQFRPPRVPSWIETRLRGFEIHRRFGVSDSRQRGLDGYSLVDGYYPNQLYKYFSYPRRVVEARLC